VIEVYKNLYVGAQSDENAVRSQPGWFFIHACKEPYHRQTLGYRTPGAPKTHPEYLLAHRPGRLILNLVDADNMSFISPIIIEAALAAIHEHRQTQKVLLHCNQGQSRSPGIALLYLAHHTDHFAGLDHDAACQAFRGLYPAYAPARGVADFIRHHWSRYAVRV